MVWHQVRRRYYTEGVDAYTPLGIVSYSQNWSIYHLILHGRQVVFGIFLNYALKQALSPSRSCNLNSPWRPHSSFYILGSSMLFTLNLAKME